MAVTTFRRLIRAGLIPDVSRRGVRVMVPLETVQSLSARSTASLSALASPEVAVLRVDAARQVQDPDREGREWTGFSTTLSPEDILKALRGWWRCDAPSVAEGGIVPVTVSSFVVAVLTGLQRWESNGRGRHAFPDAELAGYVTDLARPATHLTALTAGERERAQLLLGTRLVTHSGGPIAYVATGNRSAN
ncbi:DNA-binding protein [Streptomyces sp. NPDC059757]|uniref:DNA-binding protein n=1 Tax=Streptomyces sp. NPDC059757 TaxID=3346935 RepID=UPI0036582290